MRLDPRIPHGCLNRLAASAFSVLLLAACADGGGITEAAGSGRLTLEVAPLNLPGIDEACYALEVANNASGSSLVFSEPSVCSTSFGDGKGAITFVGSCDAQADADPLVAGVQNRVELRLNSLSSTTGDLSAPADFVNPCGDDQCVQYATCTENSDTSVTFNLTIMRSADQGFFDIGVNFSDVFCSAKVDCPTQLLFNDAGVRGPTAVVAFACTAGDTGPTYMYLDNIAFAGLTYDIRGVKGNKDANDSAAGGKFAVFKDQEDLPGYTKYFWNVAIDITGKSGNIVTKATASGQPLTSNTTPTATRYPVIDINVAVSNGSCSPNPLDGSGSGVTTGYTTLAATKTFENAYSDCATGFQLQNGVCTPAASPRLLDAYPGASAGYSLRRLSSSYAGAAIRVRRSSDNAEQDIGFNADGTLNTTSLSTFVGAGNGFVVTWYDQSGGGKHASQATPTNQPQIVANGSVYLTNNKPSIYFSGSKLLTTTANVVSTGNQPYSIYGVSQNTGTTSSTLFYIGGASGNNGIGLQVISGGSLRHFWYTREFVNFSKSIDYQTYYSVEFDGNQVYMGRNETRTAIGTGTKSTTSPTLSIGKMVNWNEWYVGYQQELLIYDFYNSTASTAGIGADVNSYYSTWDNIVSSGLVFYLDAAKTASYPGSGSTWFDLSSSDIDATLSSGPTYSSNFGGGLGFTTSQGLSTNSALPNLATYTVEIAFNPSAYQYMLLQVGPVDLKWRVSADFPYWNFWTSSGTPLQNIYSTRPSLNVPTVFVASYDGSVRKTGMNGVYQTSTTSTFTPKSSSTATSPVPATSITSPSFEPIAGALYHVRVYNRALSADEILQNFTQTRSRLGL